MPTTPLLGLTYPTEHQDPWYEIFKSLITALDAHVYAAREDSSILLADGGTMTLTLATDVFAWSADLNLFIPMTGGIRIISAGNVTLTDKKIAYVTLTRPSSGEGTITMSAGDKTGTDKNKYWVAVRVGSKVYLRNGTVITGS